MKLQGLREAVCAANRMLPDLGLVILTWGNVSAFDRSSGLIVIKPSGVPYDKLTPEHMVLVDQSGHVIEGDFSPSTDTDTHLELYRHFPSIGSVVHTHSQWATIWAQIGEDIPPLGTTHADDFGEAVLCTRAMQPDEIQSDYEKNTGIVIAETLAGRDIGRHFGVLVRGHGPFVWESTPERAVQKAIVLEYVAGLAWHCRISSPQISPIGESLLRKHFDRKHGKKAYYGQRWES